MNLLFNISGINEFDFYFFSIKRDLNPYEKELSKRKIGFNTGMETGMERANINSLESVAITEKRKEVS